MKWQFPGDGVSPSLLSVPSPPAPEAAAIMRLQYCVSYSRLKVWLHMHVSQNNLQSCFIL